MAKDILAPSTPSPTSEKEGKWEKWHSRIEARLKTFESGWWKQAEHAEKMYDLSGGNTAENEAKPFNILYANTEVLLPALYSSTPKPDVNPRNEAADLTVSHACEAYLNALVDMNTPGRETFDDAMGSVTLSALVPGAGHARIRAYPGKTCPLRVESGTYKELIWAKASKWSRVPWIAFVHTMTKEDILEQFEGLDPDKLSVPTQEDEDRAQSIKNPPLRVYELWIKRSRQVAWLCNGYEDMLLGLDEDTLKLTEFFPTPGPMCLVQKSSTLDPTPIYEYYRNQAEELNRVTVRLNKVLSAIRVRGVYNPLLGDSIASLLSDGQMENAIKKTDSPMDLMGKGFEGHIWFLPIDRFVEVATQLYTARQQIMQVIQQLTGLSDIVRGSTVASETATAQDLKNKWGSIRLQRLQKVVQYYVRDLFRLGVNAGARVLGEDEWKAICQLPIPTSQEKAQAQMQLSMLAQQAAQQQQALPPGTPPQPPAPPDPKLVAMAQGPSWKDILSTLADDNGRVYSIDIETDSTIMVDATNDKQEVGEFMQAMGQLLPGLAPIAQMGPSGIEVAKELLIAVCSKFKFGREVKGALSSLQAPPPQQNPGDQEKAQQAQADLQAAQAKAQLVQVQAQAEQQKIALETQKSQAEHQFAMQELAMKQAQMVREAQLAEQQHIAAMEKISLDREMARVKLSVAQKVAKDRMNQKPNLSKT